MGRRPKVPGVRVPEISEETEITVDSGAVTTRPPSVVSNVRSNTAYDISYFFRTVEISSDDDQSDNPDDHRKGKKKKSKKRGDVERRCIICSVAADKLDNAKKWKGPTYRYGTTTSTSTMRTHLKNNHYDEYYRVARENNWTKYLPEHRNLQRSTQDTGIRLPFTVPNLLLHLVRFIAGDDQSISVIENRQFRDILLLMRPELQDEDLPHRTKVRETIIITWRLSFIDLKGDLKRAIGVHSFTMDLWTARNRTPYLCITTHYVVYRDPVACTGIEMKANLIAFHKLGGKHSGVRIAETVTHLLKRAGLDPAKDSYWTADNASNNRTFIQEFIESVRPELAGNSKQFLLMCIPHVVNICCQHAITALNGGVPGQDGSDEEEDVDDLKNPRRGTLLYKIRGAIRLIRGSGQRINEFERRIKEGNSFKFWGSRKDGTPITITPAKLLLDVRTRWDSTYQMLERFYDMKGAIKGIMEGNDKIFNGIERFALTSQDWKLVRGFLDVLYAPHEFQMTMAGEKLPILSMAIPSFETFMTRWEIQAKRFVKKKKTFLADAIEEGLSFARKYYRRMDDTTAYTVAMIIHPGFRMSWIEDKWDKKYIVKAAETFKMLMQSYRDRGLVDLPASTAVPSGSKVPAPIRYSKKRRTWSSSDETNNSGSEDTQDEDSSMDDMDFTTRRHGQRPMGPNNVEQEYQKWVTGDLTDADINLLAYWEANRKEFPTIFRVAMDFLPIQASSVPSERVFSSSAQTDTVRRNRIQPLMMEALQMLKFSIKHEEAFDFTSHMVTPEAQLEESNYLDSVDLLHDLTSGIEASEAVMDRVVNIMEEEEKED